MRSIRRDDSSRAAFGRICSSKPIPAWEHFLKTSGTEKILSIGNEVKMKVTGPCGRCVMTTLAQGDLPKDTGVLKDGGAAQPRAGRRLCCGHSRRRCPQRRPGAGLNNAAIQVLDYPAADPSRRSSAAFIRNRTHSSISLAPSLR